MAVTPTDRGPAAPDRTIGSEHTISTQAEDQVKSPLSSPMTDSVLYCHFIPKKEFVEKGTPWIIHTPTKCYVCATVHFESMAMMRTAGPGGEAPDPVVCHCGVSRHHLRVEGYVTMSETDTPYPKATIRSHRPSLVNVPQLEKELSELKSDLKTSKKDALTATQKLTKERKDATKVREKQNEYKRIAEMRKAEVDKVQMEASNAQRKIKDKETQREELARQCATLREQIKGGSNKRPHREKPTKTPKASSVDLREVACLRAECQSLRGQAAKAQEAEQSAAASASELARLRVDTQGLREAAALAKHEQDMLQVQVQALQAQIAAEHKQTPRNTIRCGSTSAPSSPPATAVQASTRPKSATVEEIIAADSDLSSSDTDAIANVEAAQGKRESAEAEMVPEEVSTEPLANSTTTANVAAAANDGVSSNNSSLLHGERVRNETAVASSASGIQLGTSNGQLTASSSNKTTTDLPGTGQMTAADVLRQRQQTRTTAPQQKLQGTGGQRWASASISSMQLGHHQARHLLNANRGGSTNTSVVHRQQERRQQLPTTSMASLLNGQAMPARVYSGGHHSSSKQFPKTQAQGLQVHRHGRSGLHVMGDGSRANSKLWRSILTGAPNTSVSQRQTVR